MVQQPIAGLKVHAEYQLYDVRHDGSPQRPQSTLEGIGLQEPRAKVRQFIRALNYRGAQTRTKSGNNVNYATQDLLCIWQQPPFATDGQPLPRAASWYREASRLQVANQQAGICQCHCTRCEFRRWHLLPSQSGGRVSLDINEGVHIGAYENQMLDIEVICRPTALVGRDVVHIVHEQQLRDDHIPAGILGNINRNKRLE